jgi:mRNA interferase MazF
MTKRGEIYWVDFGSPIGSEQGFRRPALVVQNDTGNRVSPTTIVAAITSKLPPREFPHVVTVQPRESGLPSQSAVLLNQLRTIDQSRLQEQCGQLTVARMAEIDQALNVSLGLTSGNE